MKEINYLKIENGNLQQKLFSQNKIINEMEDKKYKEFEEKEKFIERNYNKIISIEYEILKKLYIFDNIDFKMFHRDLHPHNILINKR